MAKGAALGAAQVVLLPGKTVSTLLPASALTWELAEQSAGVAVLLKTLGLWWILTLDEMQKAEVKQPWVSFFRLATMIKEEVVAPDEFLVLTKLTG